jgi:hypothetical protein
MADLLDIVSKYGVNAKIEESAALPNGTTDSTAGGVQPITFKPTMTAAEQVQRGKQQTPNADAFKDQQDDLSGGPTLGSIAKRSLKIDTAGGAIYSGLEAAEASQTFDPEWTSEKKTSFIEEHGKGVPIQYLEGVLDSTSEEEALFRLGRANEEMQLNSDTMDRGVAGFAARMVGGLIAPETFIGLGAGGKAVANLSTMGKIMTRATLMGVESGMTDYLTGLTRETYQWTDTAMAATAGLALGGAFGTVSAKLGGVPDMLTDMKMHRQYAKLSDEGEELVVNELRSGGAAYIDDEAFKRGVFATDPRSKAKNYADHAPKRQKALGFEDGKIEGGISIAAKLQQTENASVRGIGSQMLDDPGNPSRRTTAADTDYLLNKLRTVNYGYYAGRSEWREATGVRFRDRLGNGWINDFDTLVAREINAMNFGKGLPSETLVNGGEALRKAATHVVESNRLAGKLLKDSGVLGAHNIDVDKIYMAHKWKPEKFIAAIQQGKRAELKATLQNAIRADMTQHGGFSLRYQNLSRKFANAIVARMEARSFKGESVPVDLFTGGQSGVLIKNLLTEFKLSTSEIDEFMKVITKAKEGALEGKYKRRIELDLDSSPKGSDMDFSLYDLIDTDIGRIQDNGFRQAAGEASFARVMNIKSGDEFEELIVEAGKQGLNTSAKGARTYGDKQLQTDLTLLRDTYKLMTGEALGTGAGTAKERTWMNLQAVTSIARLQGMGLTQLSETSRLAHMIGIKETLRAIPELKNMRKMFLKGDINKVNDEFLSSFEDFHGVTIGADAYLAPPATRSEFGGRALSANEDGFWKRATDLIPKVQHINGIITGQNAVLGAQQQIAAKGLAGKIFRMAKGGKLNENHFKDLGWNSRDIKMIMDDIAVHGDYDASGKRVGNMNFEKWQPETAEIFREGIFRGLDTAAQKNRIGEKAHWMYDPSWAPFTQFLSFPLVALEKQGKRAFNTGGATKLAMVTAYSYAAAATLTMSKTYLNSLGRKDQKEYLKKYLTPERIANGALNYTSTLGPLPDILGAVSGVAHGDLLATDGGMPALGYVQDVARTAGTAVGDAAGLKNRRGQNIEFDAAAYRRAFGILPFTKLPGVRGLTNAISDAGDELTGK